MNNQSKRPNESLRIHVATPYLELSNLIINDILNKDETYDQPLLFEMLGKLGALID
jgi:hypothetical protein